MCLLRRTIEAGTEIWNTGPPYERDGRGLCLNGHQPPVVPWPPWHYPPIGTVAPGALSRNGISAFNIEYLLIGMHTDRQVLLEFENCRLFLRKGSPN